MGCNIPIPPACDTAAVNSGLLQGYIAPPITGYRIPSCWQNEVAAGGRFTVIMLCTRCAGVLVPMLFLLPIALQIGLPICRLYCLFAAQVDLSQIQSPGSKSGHFRLNNSFESWLFEVYLGTRILCCINDFMDMQDHKNQVKRVLA